MRYLLIYLLVSCCLFPRMLNGQQPADNDSIGYYLSLTNFKDNKCVKAFFTGQLLKIKSRGDVITTRIEQLGENYFIGSSANGHTDTIWFDKIERIYFHSFRHKLPWLLLSPYTFLVTNASIRVLSSVFGNSRFTSTEAIIYTALIVVCVPQAIGLSYLSVKNIVFRNGVKIKPKLMLEIRKSNESKIRE